MTTISQLSNNPSFSNYSGTGLKPSIILFDFNPGTRSWVCPAGVFKVRVFVVGGGGNGSTGSNGSPAPPSIGGTGGPGGKGGGGGGYSEKIIDVIPGTSYSYTVGTSQGTSSFASIISATGASANTAGVGTGGDINSYGFSANTTVSAGGVGSAAPVGGSGAYGNGGASAGGRWSGTTTSITIPKMLNGASLGNGFMMNGDQDYNVHLDIWGIGIPVLSATASLNSFGSLFHAGPSGAGGSSPQPAGGQPGGVGTSGGIGCGGGGGGGGGGGQSPANQTIGIGGVGGSGGPGLVGIEVLG